MIHGVATIYEDTLQIGKIVSCSSWDECYEVAEGFVLDEYEKLGVDVAGDRHMLLEIQDDLRERFYHCLWTEVKAKGKGKRKSINENGKAVAVQIVRID
jgi:hypothetical protein